MKMIANTRRLVTVAAAAALAFGASQALAAPAAGPHGDEVRACNPVGCNRSCQAMGGFEGRCENGRCLCLL